MNLRDEVSAAHLRGWHLLPLNGKKPFWKNWTETPRSTLGEALLWVDRGNNVGLVTGKPSGVVVVDIDIAKGAKTPDNLPDTVTVETGSGGLHLYYRLPDGAALKNSAGKIAPNVDVRADGGQVVYPGSIHPDTKQPYRWLPGKSPDDIPVAELPAWIIAKCAEKTTPNAPGRDHTRPDATGRYARSALEREVGAVRMASEGTRNDTLNRAAFNLGQLVATGELDRSEVAAALFDAANAAGLDGKEASGTVDSGLEAGIASPRDRPRKAPPPQSSRSYQKPQSEDVLVPGSHRTPDDEYLEIGTDDFADAVLDALPKNLLYRRGGVPGTLAGEPGQRSFQPVEADSARILVDSSVRLATWEGTGKDAYLAYRTCSRNHAGLVIARAQQHPAVQDIALFTTCPVFTKHGLSQPGLHDGIYYDEPESLKNLELHHDACHDILDDLLCDFPFDSEASRQNYIGLLLTPLVRPMLDGNVPMHLVMASLERTGKTKLASVVYGELLLGHETPCVQIAKSDEENDKRILALLLQGHNTVNIDNIRAELDSSALSSLLTAGTYQGRLLGQSKVLSIPNRTVVIGSGNNIRASGEIVKRSVPVILQPKDDSPELRTDFRHKDLHAFLRTNRRLILGSLLGMVKAWIDAGSIPSKTPLGGFESWAATIGGIMAFHQFPDWLRNYEPWRRDADPAGEDLRTLVKAWHDRYGSTPVITRDLLELADSNDIFASILQGSSDRARANKLSKLVLERHTNTPVLRWLIRKFISGTRRLYFLEDPASSKIDSLNRLN